ncbi:TIGR04024 family LLM class F420-dependent oxidoreductase [Halostella pelagica]|uniref:TIGR04024 family LLM class F420-dependent oxidoreductase n=1 Tax=Halostella pelagica TaxID=2583824 RepID=UPI001080B5F9|nr:TIGR04024 family LLM class F420-dependent oxidoreductase [Halostella pelagica]
MTDEPTAADRTVHLPVAAQPSVETLVDLTRRAEDLGYERAWLPETWGRDAVTTLTSMAHGTERIGIGPSVLNVYSRSPALIAQSAATLQEVADGRLRVAVGPSGPAVIEGWHGVDFDRPLRRTREYIDVYRTVLDGETLNYDGDVFDLAGFRLRCDPPEQVPPIDAAGMGPKAVELCGRFADGWHAIVFTPEGLRDRLGDLRRGVELGGRDIDDVRVTLSLPCCALDDGERARELGAEHCAFYIGGMGTYYRDSLARQGYEDTAHDVATAWANGDRDRAVELVDDALLDDLAAVGTPDEVRDRIRTFESIDGVDVVAVSFPRAATVDDARQTLDALEP